MHRPNDPQYIRTQYATSANLDARVALHVLYSTARENFHDWLFAHANLPEDARVLEVGCGSGAMWERVYANIPRSWNITLTDLSFGMVSTVKAKFQDARFTFAEADIEALPFVNTTFDGIFANHMLYHVPNLAQGLREMRRVLKPGGVLFAATNGKAHLSDLYAVVGEIQNQKVQAPSNYADAFGLENGAAPLAPYFTHIARDDFDDNLQVTQVEPLVAYLASGASFQSVTSNPVLLEAFRRRVQNEIDTRGAFHITKSAGLFVAR